MTSSPVAPWRVRGTTGLAAVTVAAAVLLSGCTPPPPAPEPTGSAAERAWTIAVGEHPLDQTIAYVYALALNSRDSPAVVETRGPSLASLAEGESEIVVGRSMGLARQLDPEALDEIEQPSSADLVALIEDGIEDAQLLGPSAAVLDSSLVITAVTAETHEISSSAEVDDPAFAETCDELRVGVRAEIPNPAPVLAEVYDCEPAEIVTGGEAELVRDLITARLDAVLLTSSHPSIMEQELVALSDAERAFPQEQFIPVVSEEIVEEIPVEVAELSQALDDAALVTLRRLTDGDQALSPEEAAEYWLVQEGFIAEPEDWG